MASVELTRLNTVPSHLVALAMEEFPQPVRTPKATEYESNRHGHQQESRFTCSKIAEEANEEGILDEDQARRSFQQSLESLRKCTQARHWLSYQDSTSISTQGSMDSSDFEHGWVFSLCLKPPKELLFGQPVEVHSTIWMPGQRKVWTLVFHAS
ncbi:hypothetical protein NFI96_002618 [Prochilodus magdalenae]|nr:hypothetical protein NFI96_002618 [Prochilodus magdalenae]